MRIKSKIVGLMGSLLLLGACYPDGAVYYEDLDLVYTNYDEKFDFGELSSYSIPDKIVKIEGDLADGEEPEFVKEPYNTQIINQIKENMSALGWEETTDPINADLVLFPAVWTNTTIYYWYDYWCWYYPYYCGWGWGYPSAVSYTTGTLIMAMMADGEEYIEPSRVWTGMINGLLSGSYDVSRVSRAIDQAFEQSPYLKIN